MAIFLYTSYVFTVPMKENSADDVVQAYFSNILNHRGGCVATLTLSVLPNIFIGPTPGTASFFIMSSIVLFLILHIFTGTKDIISSKKETELKYRYLIW